MCGTLFDMKHKVATKQSQGAVLLFGILVGVVVTFGVVTWRDGYMHSSSSMSKGDAMFSMHDEHPPITSDKQFLEEMILHHKSAVTMSKELLEITKDEKLKKLASDIIVSQSNEIMYMKNWLREMK